MNKEDILEKSRRENKNRDLAVQEVQAQSGAVAGSVGALVCLVISIISRLILGEYLLSPWVIYFSIMGTELVVRYAKLKRRVDLASGIVILIAAVVSFALLITRMLEAAA